MNKIKNMPISLANTFHFKIFFFPSFQFLYQSVTIFHKRIFSRSDPNIFSLVFKNTSKSEDDARTHCSREFFGKKYFASFLEYISHFDITDIKNSFVEPKRRF